MAWIESHQSLEKHWKLLSLAGRLGIPKQQAIGHLHCLWWWAVDNAPSGDLSHFTPDIIAQGADWNAEWAWWEGLQMDSPTNSNKLSAGDFVLALKNSGFIDAPSWNGEQISPKVGQITISGEQISERGEHISSDPVLGLGAVLHDWLDYCGDLVKKRLERQIERKAKSANIKATVDAGRKVPPTVPYRTVPNSTVLLRKEKREGETPLSLTSKNSPKKYLPVTPEFIEEMVTQFGPQLGGEGETREIIEEALNHKAMDKRNDKRLYLRGWLRRDAKERSNGKPQNNPQSDEDKLRIEYERSLEVQRRKKELGRPNNYDDMVANAKYAAELRKVHG